MKQAIAACTSDVDLRERSGRSFTSYLVEAFTKLNTNRPFTSQRLYDEIVSQKQQYQALRSASTVASKPPVLFTLTPGKSQHLTLAPCPGRQASASGVQNGGDSGDAQGSRSREDQLIDPSSVVDLRFDEARILVCTTFVGDASSDMSFFNQWLQNTPALGAKIAVEGMFLGPPTMLLISMPHSIWSVVQHDKVCCFLGYITSHNMIHLYQKLVGPAGIKPSAKEVEEGRILLEARESARILREPDGQDPKPYHGTTARGADRPDFGPQTSPTRPFTTGGTPLKSKDDVEDSAEMQEAAEQLKALSHVRHRSDETPHPGLERQRTILPDSIPDLRHDEGQLPYDATDAQDGAAAGADPKMTPNFRVKAPRRSLPKQETRCSHCSHAPFKDSSSLRKHIAAAHTRPFPCAFLFAGCTSTFGSKNEWKRHIASQHLCLQYYRCSACPQSAAEGKGNEFNRKDLFTQHLRRMHAPFHIKRAITKHDSKLQNEWDNHVKDMQSTCLVTRRKPPQRAACPKTDCQSIFEGPSAWDEWTEHVGRHMEKGEGQTLAVDRLLAKWALDEGIVEPRENGEYRLCASNGPGNGNGGGMPGLETKDSFSLLSPDAPPLDESAVATKPAEDAMQTDA
jgi:hypothetical protein